MDKNRRCIFGSNLKDILDGLVPPKDKIAHSWASEKSSRAPYLTGSP